MKNKKMNTETEELVLDKYDDQFHQIKDALDIEESTDSETTDIVGFRVINSNNPYPEGKRIDERND